MTMLLALLLTQSPEEVGTALMKWKGENCAAFFASRGAVLEGEPSVSPDGAISCVGKSGDAHVRLELSRFRLAKDVEAFDEVEAKRPRGMTLVRRFGPKIWAYAHVTRNTLAMELLDACVTAPKIDLASTRACLTKQDWSLSEGGCDGNDVRATCFGWKGELTTSVSFDHNWTDGPHREAYLEIVRWARKPAVVTVTVSDYRLSREWLDALGRLKWDGARCTAFLSKHHFTSELSSRSEPDGTVSCSGVSREGDRAKITGPKIEVLARSATETLRDQCRKDQDARVCLEASGWTLVGTCTATTCAAKTDTMSATVRIEPNAKKSKPYALEVEVYDLATARRLMDALTAQQAP